MTTRSIDPKEGKSGQGKEEQKASVIRFQCPECDTAFECSGEKDCHSDWDPVNGWSFTATCPGCGYIVVRGEKGEGQLSRWSLQNPIAFFRKKKP